MLDGWSRNDSIEIKGNVINAVSIQGGDSNDTVYGIKSRDELRITGTTYTSVKSGNDLKINVGTGSILIKDAANIEVNIAGTLDSGSSQDTTPADTLPVGISVKSGILTASTKFTGTEINLANYDATKVNAASLSQEVTIVGNDSNNSIKAGKGADTISGGTGKNTLTGGKGEDIFVYESGNDIISDYKSGEDKIEINGTISNTSHKGKDVIFKVVNGSLTVKIPKVKKFLLLILAAILRLILKLLIYSVTIIL